MIFFLKVDQKKSLVVESKFSQPSDDLLILGLEGQILSEEVDANEVEVTEIVSWMVDSD